jgi:hypothetical protein
MQNDELILAEEFCTHHNIGVAFIDSLRDYGLIEIMSLEQERYIPGSQLHKVEQLMRLHYDLNINLEGIDAICNLLDRVRDLQSQVTLLKNRLRAYEQELFG